MVSILNICTHSILWILLLIAFNSWGLNSKTHQKIIKSSPLYPDQKLQHYVQSVVNKLTKDNKIRVSTPYLVFIIDNQSINAFVTKDKAIYLYRGLLSLLTTEAHLAAVLAHEMGHIKGMHYHKLKNSKIAKGILSTLASVYVGSQAVGDTINIISAARISGYGRELELNADQYAAQYLYGSGYNPNALIDVLKLLKNHQLFIRDVARQQGKTMQTYHGVFSSHPRTDKRLHQVINNIEMFAPAENLQFRKRFRHAIDGITYGTNHKQPVSGNKKLYINTNYGIRFEYPPSWSIKQNGNPIKIGSDKHKLNMNINIHKQQNCLPSKLNQSKLKPKYNEHNNNYATYELIVNRSSKSKQKSNKNQRKYCLQIGSFTYWIDAYKDSAALSKKDKKMIESIITSFHRPTRKDYSQPRTLSIYFKRLQPGETFASLASNSVLGKHTEQHLRLMNNFYPSGEPEPWTWIKLVH